MDKHKRIGIGVALVLGLLFLIPFGTLTFTGLTTSAVDRQIPDVATPIFLVMVVGSLGVLYFVFRTR